MDDFGLLPLLRTDPLAFLLLGAALVGAIALHEFAHALAADLQGDRMPRAMGRVTLNPARHLDPLGTLFIFLVGFGWGKPVEFRIQALSSRFGAALVALAGPLMNLLLALSAAVVASLLPSADLESDLMQAVFIPGPDAGAALQTTFTFLYGFFYVNVLLGVFNLIPLPPLDGSRLLTIFLPRDKQKVLFFLDRYGFIILLGLLFFGGFTFLDPLVQAVGSAITRLIVW